LGFGFWGLGVGGGGIGPNPQSPIPNPQSPIPNPQSPFIDYYIILKQFKINVKKIFIISNKYNPNVIKL
jgi:hypothetical protein